MPFLVSAADIRTYHVRASYPVLIARPSAWSHFPMLPIFFVISICILFIRRMPLLSHPVDLIPRRPLLVVEKTTITFEVNIRPLSIT